jgi:hypothetical protein
MAQREGQQLDTFPIQMYVWDGTNPVKLGLDNLNPGFTISKYDSITLGYTSNVLTSVVYKLSGATVATLTLTYTDGNLTGVEKT